MSKCISDFAKIAMAFNNSFNAEISVSEIAYDTQLPSSKVSRMLSALEKEGQARDLIRQIQAIHVWHVNINKGQTK